MANATVEVHMHADIEQLTQQISTMLTNVAEDILDRIMAEVERASLDGLDGMNTRILLIRKLSQIESELSS